MAVVAEYDYRDEGGKSLFQAVRLESKSFRQRHRNGSRDRTWNLDGVRRVPYRLPEALAATDAGQTLFVVEGEKDTDRLAAEGLVAICNPMGAGKWIDDYLASRESQAGEARAGHHREHDRWTTEGRRNRRRSRSRVPTMAR